MSDLNITDMELLRLNDCATSTRLGMIDQGFPETFKKLAALGLVKAKDKGVVVTELGLATIDANKHRINLPKKKAKKPKFRERDDSDWFEEE